MDVEIVILGYIRYSTDMLCILFLTRSFIIVHSVHPVPPRLAEAVIRLVAGVITSGGGDQAVEMIRGGDRAAGGIDLSAS
jgi:hypothetical protein